MKKKYNNNQYYTNNEFLGERIARVRSMTQESGKTIAEGLGISLSKYQLIEEGRISPIPYYWQFCSFYGTALANSIFTVDWSLYTGERLRTYLGHYEYNHARAAVVEMHITQSTLNRMIMRERSKIILYNHKEAIDRMFGELISNDDMRYTFAVGHNSEYRTNVNTDQQITIINKYYRSKNKHHDSEEDIEDINKEIAEINNLIRNRNALKTIHLNNENEIMDALITQYDTFLARSRKEE